MKGRALLANLLAEHAKYLPLIVRVAFYIIISKISVLLSVMVLIMLIKLRCHAISAQIIVRHALPRTSAQVVCLIVKYHISKEECV